MFSLGGGRPALSDEEKARRALLKESEKAEKDLAKVKEKAEKDLAKVKEKAEKELAAEVTKAEKKLTAAQVKANKRDANAKKPAENEAAVITASNELENIKKMQRQYENSASNERKNEDDATRARMDAESKARADAAAKERMDADARARTEAKARADAAARAEADAKARAKADADSKARAEADAKARAKADADSKARAEADAKARAKADADAKARADADAKARAQADADAKARAEAEAKADDENLNEYEKRQKAWDDELNVLSAQLNPVTMESIQAHLDSIELLTTLIQMKMEEEKTMGLWARLRGKYSDNVKKMKAASDKAQQYADTKHKEAEAIQKKIDAWRRKDPSLFATPEQRNAARNKKYERERKEREKNREKADNERREKNRDNFNRQRQEREPERAKGNNAGPGTAYKEYEEKARPGNAKQSSPNVETNAQQEAANKAGKCASYRKEPVYCKTRADYLRQTREFHPDKNTGCKLSSETKFKKLTGLCENYQQVGGINTRKKSKMTRTRHTRHTRRT